MRPLLNQITAEFDMSGRCTTCSKKIRRRVIFRDRTFRGLRKQVDEYNNKHPFYCKTHKPKPL